jgi:hypothetical protein
MLLPSYQSFAFQVTPMKMGTADKYVPIQDNEQVEFVFFYFLTAGR